jgi:hypothetical protein
VTADEQNLIGARGEVLACGLGLGLITLLMCAVHIRNGGFYYDDWSVLALGRFLPPGGLLPGLWLDYGQRPGQALYYAALDEGLGSQAGPRLALAAAMVALEATCLYALLRRLGLAVRHAAAIAALLLTFPFSDSVWLWGILSLTSLAIAGALLGVILALRALESSSRARARALRIGRCAAETKHARSERAQHRGKVAFAAVASDLGQARQLEGQPEKPMWNLRPGTARVDRDRDRKGGGDRSRPLPWAASE